MRAPTGIYAQARTHTRTHTRVVGKMVRHGSENKTLYCIEEPDRTERNGTKQNRARGRTSRVGSRMHTRLNSCCSDVRRLDLDDEKLATDSTVASYRREKNRAGVGFGLAVPILSSC